MLPNSNTFYPLSSQVATRSLVVDATGGGVPFVALTNKDGLLFFDVQDADVMMTMDGATAPVDHSVGHRLSAGTNYTVNAKTAGQMKFIRVGSTSARIAYSECAMG